MSSLQQPVSRVGPILRGIAFGALILLILPFTIHAVTRGLSLTDAAEIATSRFILPGAVLSNLAIYGHMLTGGLLTMLAPIQMLGGLRRRWPRAHHVNGYVLLVLATLTGVGGLVYIARQGTIGGSPMSLGFAIYGILLLLAAMRTVQLARMRDHRHPIWACRLIILALASWFYRVQYGLWVGLIGAVGTRPDFSGPFDLAMNVGFYLPWLIIYEIVQLLRRRRSSSPSA